MKNIIKSVIILLLSLTTIPFCVNCMVSQDPFPTQIKDGDFYYHFGSEGYIDEFGNPWAAASFKGYVGTDKDVIVPETLGGIPVMDIDTQCFTSYTPTYESITFPKSVVVIRRCSGFPNLKTIIIPDNVNRIDGSAFRDCISLTSIKLPKELKSINAFTFYGCVSLEEVIIPENVVLISGYAFTDCPKLKSIFIPKTVESIGGNFPISENGWDPYLCGPIADRTCAIKGYRNTEAERYALEYGHEFIALDDEQSIPGDANCDGEVSIADVVAVRLYCLDPEKYPFKYNGEANALVIEGQTTVQGNCAIAIQDFVVEKIKMLPIAG